MKVKEVKEACNDRDVCGSRCSPPTSTGTRREDIIKYIDHTFLRGLGCLF